MNNDIPDLREQMAELPPEWVNRGVQAGGQSDYEADLVTYRRNRAGGQRPQEGASTAHGLYGSCGTSNRQRPNMPSQYVTESLPAEAG